MNHLNKHQEYLLPQTKDRFFSFDFLKAISIVSVVSFHSILVPRSTYVSSELAIIIIFSSLKFCVPIFLTISFFLLERSLAMETSNANNLPIIKKRLTRLFMPTIFWFSLTALLKLINKNSWHEVVGSIFTGTVFTGAYYLLILLQFVTVFTIFRCWFHKPINVVIACIMQCIVYSLIYSIHSHTEALQIINILKIIHRPLFIYWFIYPILGIFTFKKWSLIVNLSSKLNWRIKSIIIGAYIFLQSFEAYYQFSVLKAQIPPFDYTMFSCVLSVPVMLICFASIQENQLHPFILKLVKILSKYSLGIFCINGILCQILSSLSLHLFAEARFNFYEILIVKLVSWLLLLSVSLGFSILLDRIGLRAVVR
jgi:surface polysaccharide O-acyltransferase-like enzyme